MSKVEQRRISNMLVNMDRNTYTAYKNSMNQDDKSSSANKNTHFNTISIKQDYRAKTPVKNKDLTSSINSMKTINANSASRNGSMAFTLTSQRFKWQTDIVEHTLHQRPITGSIKKYQPKVNKNWNGIICKNEVVFPNKPTKEVLEKKMQRRLNENLQTINLIKPIVSFMMFELIFS